MCIRELQLYEVITPCPSGFVPTPDDIAVWASANTPHRHQSRLHMLGGIDRWPSPPRVCTRHDLVNPTETHPYLSHQLLTESVHNRLQLTEILFISSVRRSRVNQRFVKGQYIHYSDARRQVSPCSFLFALSADSQSRELKKSECHSPTCTPRSGGRMCSTRIVAKV